MPIDWVGARAARKPLLHAARARDRHASMCHIGGVRRYNAGIATGLAQSALKYWYAVYSKPRQEAVAAENLDRQGFTTWLPLIRRAQRRKGRWVDLTEPLFPRYLFLRVDVGRQDMAPIRSTRGVSGLVRMGGVPAVVPDAVVEGLLGAMEQTGGVYEAPRKPLHRGDRVRVLDGPFEGVQGIFQAENGSERVVVLLDLIGQQNRVSISRRRVTALG